MKKEIFLLVQKANFLDNEVLKNFILNLKMNLMKIKYFILFIIVKKIKV